MSSKKNATIYDIADEAGVSISTVSRVLTGSAPVREETRMRVEQAIGKFDFQPNALARGLALKETKTIGFILPDINNPFFSSVFREAEEHALKKGYTMLLCNSMDNQALESGIMQTLVEKQVDGIIFMGGRINKTHTDPALAEEMNKILVNTPIVMINGRMKDVNCHRLRSDERAGVFALMQYLANMGHRTVGLLGGQPGITSRDIKLRAFKSAAKEYGLKFEQDWIIPCGFTIDGGSQAMERLLSCEKRPSALMGINDLVAIGAIITANKHGYTVPGDFSVTGFDNIYLAEIFPPGLTTVNQNLELLGQLSTDIMVGLLNQEQVRKETVVKTSLVVRDSCQAV
jgi:DNA-binding LacI/PurR family transcriptional regulator